MREHLPSSSSLVLAIIGMTCAVAPLAFGQIGYCPVTTQVPTGNPVATLPFDARVNECYANPYDDPTRPCCSAAASIDLPAGQYIVTLNGEVWSTEGYGGPAALPIAWGSGSCPSHSSANCCFLADPRIAGGGPILINHPGGPVYVWRNDNYFGDNYGLSTINFYAATPNLDFAVTIPGATASSTGDLPFCSEDRIHCEVTNPDLHGLTVSWSIEPTITDVLDPRYFSASPNNGTGTSIEFNLESLNDWLDYTPSLTGIYVPRSQLSFKVTATLSDGSNPVSKIITQSRLGQLRQEYVDFPVNNKKCVLFDGIPGVSAFTSEHAELNFGDYRDYGSGDGWALLTGWAVYTAPRIMLDALAASPPINTVINSCYRNPVHNANIYLDLILKHEASQVNWCSPHQWGLAIDFASTEQTYCPLANISEAQGVVIAEGKGKKSQRTDHVHVQDFGSQQKLPACQ